jgi:hypothetical protein
MKALGFSDLTLSELRQRVELVAVGIDASFWEPFRAPLTPEEREAVRALSARLQDIPLIPMNEATLWARVLYPLLMLAETRKIIAWSEIALSARFAHFALEGTADGTLAEGPLGIAEPPYFVVLEAKRGMEARNPQPQLIGQLLAATQMNGASEAFGAFTVGDNWTFVHARVEEPESERPTLTVTFSNEYAERTQAEQILSLLKGIVAYQLQGNDLHTTMTQR